MQEVKSFFEKIKKALFKEEFRREAVAATLDEVVGLRLEEKEIVIKDNKIVLKTSPLVKSEVALKRKQITAVLKEKHGIENLEIF